MGLELTCDAQRRPSPYCCVNVLRWPGLLRRRCGLAAIGNETATKNAPQFKLRPDYAGIHQITQNLRSHYAEITQPLRSLYAEFTQPLRRFTQPLRSHYAAVTQSLRSRYAIITQCLRNVYAALRNLITQHYAIVLRNCFTQLFYAIVLRNCFTQLFYAFLRMSVNEKFTQKSCNLRKGQLADDSFNSSSSDVNLPVYCLSASELS